MVKFRSIKDHQASRQAQKDFDRAGSANDSERPPDAIIFEGELIGGDKPITIDTPWGEVIGQPEDWLFTSPEGFKFVVHDADVQVAWEAI